MDRATRGATILTVVLGLSISPGWGQAQPQGDQDPLLRELIARDPARNGYALVSNASGALVESLWGDLWPASPAGPLRTAQEFIDRFGSILEFPRRIDIARDLVGLSPRDAGGGQALRLAPGRNGIPYIQGTIVVRFSAQGDIVAISGRYRDVSTARMGSIDAARAARIALDELARRYDGARLTGDGTEQEYLEDAQDGSIEHHYQVEVVVGDPGRSRRVLLGPSGEVLGEELAERSTAPDANVIPQYPSMDEATRDLPGLDAPASVENPLVFSATGRVYRIRGPWFQSTPSWPYPAASASGHFPSRPFPDEEGPFTRLFQRSLLVPRGAPAGSGVVLWTQAPIPDVWFLEANCYYHLMRARDRAKAWGASEVDRHHPIRFDVVQPCTCRWRSRPPALVCQPHQEVTRDNAYYRTADHSIRYDAIQRALPRHPGLDPSVTYHEYAHYVLSMLNPLHASGGSPADRLEAEAVNEGWADYFASSITGDPGFGKVWNGGTALRTAQNSLTRDQVTPCTRSDTCTTPPSPCPREIHRAGQLFSGACWEIQGVLANDRAIELVIASLRHSRTPITFRRAAVAIVQEHAALAPGPSAGSPGDHQTQHQRIVEILRTRGLLPEGP